MYVCTYACCIPPPTLGGRMLSVFFCLPGFLFLQAPEREPIAQSLWIHQQSPKKACQKWSRPALFLCLVVVWVVQGRACSWPHPLNLMQARKRTANQLLLVLALGSKINPKRQLDLQPSWQRNRNKLHWSWLQSLVCHSLFLMLHLSFLRRMKKVILLGMWWCVSCNAYFDFFFNTHALHSMQCILFCVDFFFGGCLCYSGEETVRGLHSQKWIHRMDSIKEVSSSMDTYKSSKRSVKVCWAALHWTLEICPPRHPFCPFWKRPGATIWWFLVKWGQSNKDATSALLLCNWNNSFFCLFGFVFEANDYQCYFWRKKSWKGHFFKRGR